ncbi:papain-like cysteine protease family protein [Xanthomonas rydalmerensis]|uniref:Papain-like cysteine protease family protein n=1 Tax=Xanthomonas rydalmerensis TaxID=3046274 RepID=A0ABZ0JPT7_9XANT|nr:papain-like cysteine protease family protein [Xanthomonas sp. DM-2023]WOS41152.1 papain-like cysteine protease family protein [Xanthomonas sp. DM-2023]WOS45337.1 papain-like cysteine protease family protein [Xanthomonas sp. DM-2023]WOS49516.1 papain-like cysteine protease family protein [Xanthomonas sp. DM-2023]WOS53696.1 papain-like cysteine protease family protein [Xanthomonas sp. DM-2023]WOS57879.1 papain-like cysteine protease family protein [Xanthomonas sp. DM-2023]
MLSFTSAVPADQVLTYALKDSTPGASPIRFSLACDGTMEYDCGHDIPPWTVDYYVNENKRNGKLLSNGQCQVPQAGSLISVDDGHHCVIGPPAPSALAGESFAPIDGVPATGENALLPALPQVLSTAAPGEPAIGFAPAHADAAPTVAPPRLRADIAGYVQQAQVQTQWCWAAVASSVATFYAPPPNPEFSQCWLACWATGADTCCADGGSAACNQPQLQSQALQHVGHRRASSAGRLSFAEVRAEIDALRPIAVTVLWARGGGHALVITGYSTLQSRPYVTVQDPSGAATALVALDDFPIGGSWNWTVTTRA